MAVRRGASRPRAGATRRGRAAAQRGRRRRLPALRARRRRQPLVERALDEPSGLPVVVLLETREHVDFTDLDDDRAAELGPLLLKIQRAVLAVPGVGNVHVGRWGEGSEHCHIWFMARPARLEQLRSSFAAIWDDVLPPVPADIWRANLEIVRRELERG